MSTCWWDEHVNNLYPVKINHHPTTEMKNKQTKAVKHWFLDQMHFFFNYRGKTTDLVPQGTFLISSVWSVVWKRRKGTLTIDFCPDQEEIMT